MENFYTPLDEARQEIQKRCKNSELRKKVEEFLKGDIPEQLKHEPKLVAWRAIMSPDNESKRLLEYSKNSGLDFAVFEHLHDKFVAWNLDKYSLAVLFINNGTRGNGSTNVYKAKIVDIDAANGKSFDSIKTIWNQNLADFHHEILYEIFPEFKDKITDFSNWTKEHGGRAKIYYDYFISLFIAHGILVENFEFEDEEGEFTREVLYPAYIRNCERFGVKPLIVRLAPDDFESNPSWWYYSKDLKPLLEERIKIHKLKNA